MPSLHDLLTTFFLVEAFVSSLGLIREIVIEVHGDHGEFVPSWRSMMR